MRSPATWVPEAVRRAQLRERDLHIEVDVAAALAERVDEPTILALGDDAEVDASDEILCECEVATLDASLGLVEDDETLSLVEDVDGDIRHHRPGLVHHQAGDALADRVEDDRHVSGVRLRDRSLAPSIRVRLEDPAVRAVDGV